MLYDNYINLSKRNEQPSFNHDVFNKAINEIYTNKEFNINKSKNFKNLVNETYRVLSSVVKEEVPNELTFALKNDIFYFSGFKSFQQLNEVSSLLRDEKTGGFKSFERFKTDVLKIDNTYNRNYLNAEYNFAVSSCQMAVKWQDFEQNADEYNLQYRTAGDDKVRADHQALNGTTLPIDDPFWNSFLPPLDWNCRCTVVEVLKNKYKISDSQLSIERGKSATSLPRQKIFRFNSGKELKIFPLKHPYYKTYETDLIKKIIKRLQPEEFTDIQTNKGKVRISNKQTKQERKENINIATHLANKYNYSIDLIGAKVNAKTPDSYNKTLGIYQEYKVSKTNTKNSIDSLLKKGYLQAENVVLLVDMTIDKQVLANAITDRINRTKNAKTLHVIMGEKDLIYTREEILKKRFKIQ